MADETPVFLDPIGPDTPKIGIVYIQSSAASIDDAAARTSRPFVFAAADAEKASRTRLYDRIASVCASRNIAGYAMRAVDVYDADVPDFYASPDGNAIFLRKQFPIRYGDLGWACSELNLTISEIEEESLKQTHTAREANAEKTEKAGGGSASHREASESAGKRDDNPPDGSRPERRRTGFPIAERISKWAGNVALRARLARLRFSRRKTPRIRQWRDRRLPIGDETHLLGPARISRGNSRPPAKRRAPESVEFKSAEPKTPPAVTIGQETAFSERLTNYEAFVFITTDRQILRHADTAGFAFIASGKGDSTLVKPRETSDRKSAVSKFNGYLKDYGVSTFTKRGIPMLRRVRVAFERGSETEGVSWLADEASAWSSKHALPCAFYTHFRFVTSDGEIGEPCAYVIYIEPEQGVSLAKWLADRTRTC